MITVIKKEKKGRRQGKKSHLQRDSNLGPLFQHFGFTTRPRGLSRHHCAKSFDLNETDVIFAVNTSKEV